MIYDVRNVHVVRMYSSSLSNSLKLLRGGFDGLSRKFYKQLSSDLRGLRGVIRKAETASVDRSR